MIDLVGIIDIYSNRLRLMILDRLTNIWILRDNKYIKEARRVLEAIMNEKDED